MTDSNHTKIICAQKCTDINVMMYCILLHLTDLQTYLESIGAFSHERKRAVNNALRVVNQSQIAMDAVYRNVDRNWNIINSRFCDKFTDAIDTHIGMSGIEREMNIIIPCCERILRYGNEVMMAGYTSGPLVTAMRVRAIPAMLSVFRYERHDLEMVFDQQLAKIYDGKRIS